MLDDEKLLRIFRAKLGATKTLYKTAAKQSSVSRSMFSQYVNGELPMPDKVKHRLIKILGLTSLLEKLEKISNGSE
jgi:hypothetical protein